MVNSGSSVKWPLKPSVYAHCNYGFDLKCFDIAVPVQKRV